MILPLIISNLLIVGSFIWKYNSLPTQIPLFYSLPWGEDQLGELWMLFFLPALMNGFVFLNNFLIAKYFSDQAMIKKIVNYLNIFLMIAFTVVFLKIIFLIS